MTWFGLRDFRNCGATTKWSAVCDGAIPAGPAAFNTYVVTGTLAEVVSLMRTLYLDGL